MAGSIIPTSEGITTDSSYTCLVPFERLGQYSNKIYLRWTVVNWASNAHSDLNIADNAQLCIGGTKIGDATFNCIGKDTGGHIDSPIGYRVSDGTIELQHILTGIDYNSKSGGVIECIMIKVESFADAARTKKLDPGGPDGIYKLSVTPTDQIYIPLENCPKDVFHTEEDMNAVRLPGNGTNNSGTGNKTFWFCIPQGYTKQAPRTPGVVLSLNLNPISVTTYTLSAGTTTVPEGFPGSGQPYRTPKKFRTKDACEKEMQRLNNSWPGAGPFKCTPANNATQIAECYITGTPTRTKPSQDRVWEVEANPVPDSADLNEGTPDIPAGFIHPDHTVMENDCDACWGSHDAYLLDEFSHQAFTKAGWTVNFSELEYSGVEFDLPLYSDDKVVGSKHVTFNTAKRTAMHKEELFALPNGIGTRIFKDGGMEVFAPDQDIDPQTGNVKEAWIKHSNYFYQINAAISETMQYLRTFSKTCQFMASKQENVVEDYGTEGKSREATKNYSVATLSQAQRKMFAQQVLRSSVNIGAGFDVSDIAHFKINLSASMVEGQSINDEYAEDEFKDMSASLGVSIKFDKLLELIAYIDTPTTELGKSQRKKKFTDCLQIDISLGDFGSSSRTLTEYKTDADGNILLNDENGEKMAKDSQTWSTMKNTIGKFQSMSLGYRMSVINGFDVGISSQLTATNGVIDFKSLKANMAVSVGGTTGLFGEKDNARWSWGWNAGGKQSLAVTASKDLGTTSSGTTGKLDMGVTMAFGGGGANLSTNKSGNAVGATTIGGFTLTPSFKASGNIGSSGGLFSNVLDGLSYSVNILDQSASIGNSWKHASDKSWLDKKKGDKLEIDFSFRMSTKTGASGLGAPNFSFGADMVFQKTLVDFENTLGKLVLTANGTAKFTNAGGANGPWADPGLYVGMALQSSITWQQNILGWLGLPINIHPRIGAGFACNFHFGGYTKGLNGSNNGAVVPGAKEAMPDSFRYTFVLGTFGYDIEMVDKFRNHMERQNVNILSGIPILSLLANCPVINRLGTLGLEQESVWEYVIRSTPTRALLCAAAAAKECDGERKKMFTKFYDEEVRENNKFGSNTPNCPRGDNKKAYWDNLTNQTPINQDNCDPRKGGSVNCEDKNLCHPLYMTTNSNGDKYDKDKPSTWEQAKGANGEFLFTKEGCATGHIFYNPDLFDLSTEPYRTKSLNNWIGGQENVLDRFGKKRKPGPCIMTANQCRMKALVRVQREYDNTPAHNRCSCMKVLFEKFLQEAYYKHYWHGRKGGKATFKTELDAAGIGEGVLMRGIESIDALVLDQVLQNRDFVNDKRAAQAFADALKEELKNLLTNVQYGQHHEGIVGEGFVTPSGKKKWITPKEIEDLIDDHWGEPAKSGLGQYLDGCPGVMKAIKDLGAVLFGVGKFLGHLVTLGAFKKDDEQSDIDRAYTSEAVCGDLNRTKWVGGVPAGPEGQTDDTCYKEYTNWMYYIEAYRPWIDKYWSDVQTTVMDFNNSTSGSGVSIMPWSHMCQYGQAGRATSDGIDYVKANADRFLHTFEIIRSNGLADLNGVQQSIDADYIDLLTPTRGPQKGVDLNSQMICINTLNYITNTAIVAGGWGGCRPDMVGGCHQFAKTDGTEDEYSADQIFKDEAMGWNTSSQPDPNMPGYQPPGNPDPDNHYSNLFFVRAKHGTWVGDPLWGTTVHGYTTNPGDDVTFAHLNLFGRAKNLAWAAGKQQILASWIAELLSRPMVEYGKLWNADRLTGSPESWNNWGKALLDFKDLRFKEMEPCCGGVQEFYRFYLNMDKFKPTKPSDLADLEFESWMLMHLQDAHMVAGDFLRAQILNKLSQGKLIIEILHSGWVVKSGADWVVRDDTALKMSPGDIGGAAKSKDDVTTDFIKLIYNESMNENCDGAIGSVPDPNDAASPSFKWIFKNGGVAFFGNIYNQDNSKNFNNPNGHPEQVFIRNLMLQLIKGADQADVMVEKHYEVDRVGNVGYKEIARKSPAAMTEAVTFKALCTQWVFGSAYDKYKKPLCVFNHRLHDLFGIAYPNRIDLEKYLFGSKGSAPQARTATGISLQGEPQGSLYSAVATTVGCHPAAKLMGRIPQGISQPEADQIRQETLKIKSRNADGSLDLEKYTPE